LEQGNNVGQARCGAVERNQIATGPLVPTTGSDSVLLVVVRHHHEPRNRAEERIILPITTRAFTSRRIFLYWMSTDSDLPRSMDSAHRMSRAPARLIGKNAEGVHVYDLRRLTIKASTSDQLESKSRMSHFLVYPHGLYRAQHCVTKKKVLLVGLSVTLSDGVCLMKRWDGKPFPSSTSITRRKDHECTTD
jgi:hypothetical protein